MATVSTISDVLQQSLVLNISAVLKHTLSAIDQLAMAGSAVCKGSSPAPEPLRAALFENFRGLTQDWARRTEEDLLLNAKMALLDIAEGQLLDSLLGSYPQGISISPETATNPSPPTVPAIPWSTQAEAPPLRNGSHRAEPTSIEAEPSDESHLQGGLGTVQPAYRPQHRNGTPGEITLRTLERFLNAHNFSRVESSGGDPAYIHEKSGKRVTIVGQHGGGNQTLRKGTLHSIRRRLQDILQRDIRIVGSQLVLGPKLALNGAGGVQ